MPPTLRIPTMKWNPPMFGARDIAYWISRLMATVDAGGDGSARWPSAHAAAPDNDARDRLPGAPFRIAAYPVGPPISSNGSCSYKHGDTHDTA